MSRDKTDSFSCKEKMNKLFSLAHKISCPKMPYSADQKKITPLVTNPNRLFIVTFVTFLRIFYLDLSFIGGGSFHMKVGQNS